MAHHLGGNTEVESVSRRASPVRGGVPEVVPVAADLGICCGTAGEVRGVMKLRSIRYSTWLIVVISIVFAAGSIGLASPAGAKTCDGKKVPCEIGDTGPGGGIVFYDAGSRQKWGRYLEAPGKRVAKPTPQPPQKPTPDYSSWQVPASVEWAHLTRVIPMATWKDKTRQWCPEDAPGYDTYLPTGTAIGTGRANTQIVIAACGADTAAGLAASYRGGGEDDWFLPSRDELGELYRQRKEVGGLADDFFWSSSQLDDDAYYAWFQYFDGGNQDYDDEDFDYRVRPVRAF